MLESVIPAYVDTRKIFLQQGDIRGQLSLERLPRFINCLADEKGSVTIDLKFRLNDARQGLISGRLQAEVNVICQRCLEPLAIQLADDIRLAVVKDEDAAKQLESELDPWICQDHKLNLAELVEEQLILCMPLVSYHDGGECINRKNYVSGESKGNEEAKSASAESPFSVLMSLKESDATD